MPFGLRTWCPRDHVLDEGSDPPWERANLGGEWASHCKVSYRDILRSSVERRLNRQRCRLVCGLRWVQGIVSYIRVQIPLWEGAILGERVAHCKVYGLSAVLCANRLNQARRGWSGMPGHVRQMTPISHFCKRNWMHLFLDHCGLILQLAPYNWVKLGAHCP